MRADLFNRPFRDSRLWLMLMLIASLTGCSSPATPDGGTVSTWLRSEVYFGLTRRDGTTITDEQWNQFLNDRIVPEFPRGLTVLSADGRWRDDWGVVRAEPSRVLVVLYRTSETSFDTKLRRVARLYAEEFDQETVMRADLRPRVEFIYAPRTPPTTTPTKLPATYPATVLTTVSTP